MRESAVEGRLTEMLRERSALCLKFVSPGNPGVPDRIVLLPGGRVVFVEVKAQGGQLGALQERQIARMRGLGADVRVLKGVEQVRGEDRELMAEGVRLRDCVCIPEIWEELFGGAQDRLDVKTRRELHSIMQHMPGWERYGKAEGKMKLRAYGAQRVYLRKVP